MSDVKDIHIGEEVSAWEDDEIITLQFPFCAITFFKDDWSNIKKDLIEIIKKAK